MKRRRYDFSFRPESYWPRGARNVEEVDIARVTFSTSPRETFALKAARAERSRIAYRIVHEDVRGGKKRIRVEPASSARPLSFGELVEMLDAACYAGRCDPRDECYRTVIWGTLQMHLEHCGGCGDDYASTVEVTSGYYPQLERYYGERLDEWCLEHCAERV